MDNETKTAIDGLGEAWVAFKAANDARLAEIEKKGAADPLLTEQVNKINGFMDETKDKMAKIETAMNRTGGESKANDGSMETKEAKEYADSFKSYLRSGEDANLNVMQRKAMSVSSDPDGGYTVTPQMSSTIITKIFETSPIRQLATVETISTDALDYIVDNDSMQGSWAGEQASRTATTTAQLGKKQIVAHELYAMPKATQKLLDDSAINIEAWIAGKVADIFGRTENTGFVLGTGVSQPRGFMTYASGTTWGSSLEQIGSGTSGVFTADGLIALQTALKEPYQNGATFLMTRTSVGLVRKLKDGAGRYLWEPSYQAGKPDILLGRPLVMAADVAEATASSLSAAYGDFKQGYTIVDRMGVRILRDPFSAKPFVQFYTTKRVGGDVTNFDAIKIQSLA